MLLTTLGGCLGCARVEQGYTGLIVDNFGSEKGSTDAIQEVYGRVYYNAYTKDYYENPNFVQRVVWTKDDVQGSAGDEALRILSQDQLEFTVDVGFSWYISAETGCSSALFRKYRKSAAELSQGELRDVVRSNFQDVFSMHKADYIYGEGRPYVLEAVEDSIRSELGAIRGSQGGACFLVENVRLLKLDPPNSIKDAVEAKIKEDQTAQTEQKKLLTQRYRLAQDSLAAVQQALNNKTIQESLTPELIQLKLIEKWDGRYPQVVAGSGSGLMLQLPAQR